MKGAFVILLFLIVVGIILYVFELIHRRRHAGDASKAENPDVNGAETQDVASATETEDSGECCGLHLVCEKDSLSPMSSDIIYYDDEELDRFKGREADSYTPEEEEEFRDVLLTLQPQDVAGWARSITQRGLQLPPEVRDELLMLVREQRAKK